MPLDPDTYGTYGGYDRTCPPIKNERINGYDFTVDALNIATLDRPDASTADVLIAAMTGMSWDKRR